MNSIQAGCFAINPEERLRPGLPEKDPAVIIEEDLGTVQFADFLNSPTGKC